MPPEMKDGGRGEREMGKRGEREGRVERSSSGEGYRKEEKGGKESSREIGLQS